MTAFEQYETRFPSSQNAIDAVEGWVCAFPEEYGVNAGSHYLFNDVRVHSALEQFGSVDGKSILEIGPLEGAHTLAFANAGAHVDAIEANKSAYLRCLVTKEITKMQNANFYLGDVISWLENNPKRYDMIFASGILYHMNDPLRLLEAIANRTDAVFIWTHFVDVDAIADERVRANWNGTRELKNFRGHDIRLYRRSYVQANLNKNFSGGAFDNHRWMDRGDILKAISALGMTDVRVLAETSSDYGPHFSIFAKRPIEARGS